ncbi:DUF5683 domain-containing protein [Hymenobacter negativus]|uniref:DUF5683 domain-containing protein n=1 Tax=Hymenobacter negativus TaxID=2795026 RepID=A0ABS0Q716_9BACT|nr:MULTISPECIES: DUF5683 domain-containing protein [Bacteria]MBH8558420.1 hypothetical protein [Hymenobacter negativus]MBH8568910.1 hypothetical protein [Hymenobacter negativus]MBR7208645.1 hypothetical protein [Microvirga sp. STS02]
MKNLYSYLAGFAVLAGGLLGSYQVQAQVFGSPSTITPATPTTVVPDTTERREVVVTPAAKKQKAAADSAKRTEHMFRAFGFKGIRLTRPGKAAMLALVLPGAGQIYNHRYWKLPLVYGALGGVIYGELYYQKHYSDFAYAYNEVTAGRKKVLDPNFKSGANLVRSVDGLNSGVIFYRGYRDIFYLYIGLAYGLQIVDALVDAHLQDFDVSDDLSLHWEPRMMAVPGQTSFLPTTPGVMFALRVK